jgi:toxin FitB
MSYLLDTNVVSEFRKRERTNPRLVAWLNTVEGRELYLSVVTVGELARGVHRLQPRDRIAAAALNRWVRSLLEGFTRQILPVDRRIAEVWGRMTAGATLPAADALIAATAEVHSLVVVTRNVKDMARTGVHCLDPFAP